MSKKFSNNLINEKSPYLQQHAHNPVDWHPWGDEAFAKAKQQNKPIFLSIGYSTCHWCHVMEKESFEDTRTAELMNEAFINIKVDREERPDIDNIYMTACQIVNGSGGWPLSIIMTPDKKPFFAGTYIPRESHGGRAGMMDMCRRTLEIWDKHYDDILKSAEELTSHLNSNLFSYEGNDLDDSILRKTYHNLASSYDSKNGGFSTKPKFPLAHNILFLSKYAEENPNSEAKEMVTNSLQKMRMGGIYDHAGKGFHRYSTDEQWLLPHFEKMLYDQAMMIMAYSESYALTNNSEFKNTVYEIIDYLDRVMLDESGAYYSAEDADSDGEEGKFYLWEISEIREILSGKTEHFVKLFNLKTEGNYFDELTRDYTGKNILYRTQSVDNYAAYNKMNIEALHSQVEESLNKLKITRENRTKPLLDDKILTDWNALLAVAYSSAGRIFNDEILLAKAKNILRFINSEMLNGTLFHLYKEGEKSINGMIDDYAYTIWALIEYYQATFEVEYLDRAISLQLLQNKEFFDKEEGGFYYTPESGEKLIARKKELYDGALPSGNSVSYMNLNRLYKLTGNIHYSELADKTQKLFASQVLAGPAGYSQFITGFGYNSKVSKEIVIVANKSDDAIEHLKYINSKYLPFASIILKTRDNDRILDRIAPYTSAYSIDNNKTSVYICENFSCAEPIENIEKLKEIL